jgi:hypothetical protein
MKKGGGLRSPANSPRRASGAAAGGVLSDDDLSDGDEDAVDEGELEDTVVGLYKLNPVAP